MYVKIFIDMKKTRKNVLVKNFVENNSKSRPFLWKKLTPNLSGMSKMCRITKKVCGDKKGHVVEKNFWPQKNLSPDRTPYKGEKFFFEK